MKFPIDIADINISLRKFYDAVYQRIIRYRRGFVWILAFIVAGVVLGLYLFGALDRLELLTLDWRFNLRPAYKTPSDIVFIDMAEDSVEAIGRWPWPRKWHAALVKILSEYEPKAIAFDVIFSEPQDQTDDSALEEALRQSRVVYMPILYDLEQSFDKYFYRGEGVEAVYRPIRIFRPYLMGSGHINAIPDIDGILRRVPPLISFEDFTSCHFGIAIGSTLLGANIADITIDPASHLLYIKLPDDEGRTVPLDRNNQLIVNWLGPWGEEFKHYSYIDVIKSYAQIKEGEDPLVDLNEFRNKICIVGLTAAGLIDIKPIPISNAYPAVGTNAMVVSSVIDNNFLKPAGEKINILLILVVCILSTVSLCRMRFLGGMVLALVGIIIYFLLSVSLFIALNYIIVTFYPIFGIFLSYVLTASYTHIMQTVERARLFKQATRDGLTHLYNIRHFSLLLDAEFKNAAAFKIRPLSIIMADVDNFKYANDTFGHQAGDAILKDIAHVIETKCRRIDVVGRYGGEEFIVMLAGSKAEDAADVAEKIRAAVEGRKFRFENTIYSTSISIGVAQYTDEKNKDDLVDKADRALYKAKQTGKNKVCVYRKAE